MNPDSTSGFGSALPGYPLERPRQDPHLDSPILSGGSSMDSQRKGKGLLLVHGRGASAESILPLAAELGVWESWSVLAPQAAFHTWYPYSFLAPRTQNQPWLDSALHKLADCMQTFARQGIASKDVVLCGFSQGACLASEFTATWPGAIGGLIAFSGGLIGETLDPDRYLVEGSSPSSAAPFTQRSAVPVFLGCSDIDPHIPKDRVLETESVFKRLGARVDCRIYPGMGHTIQQDEVDAAKALLARI